VFIFERVNLADYGDILEKTTFIEVMLSAE
jgi:hypothetical protein